MSRRIKLKDGSEVEKCPKCENNIEFDIHSQQVAEDCCEIWASCICGFDPTSHENMGSNYRMEDVWGGCSDENCIDAVCCSWNDAILDYNKKHSQP